MITNVPGVAVGQYTDRLRATGCTVILFDRLCPAAVDIAGGAPGTRETDLLHPGRLVAGVNAIVLSGGSAFGLAAADGVAQFLRERGIGLPTPAGPVPIVASAVIYDLDVGDSTAYPGAWEGKLAAAVACSSRHSMGSVGAGTGAVVGRFLGADRATKGGLGASAAQCAGGTVAVLAVVNSLGNVIDPCGTIVAGARSDKGGFVRHEIIFQAEILRVQSHTVLTVAVTDLEIDRDLLAMMARGCNTGIARVVQPAHTLFDGDVAFAVSTGRSGPLAPGLRMQLGVLCSELAAQAVRTAISEAVSVGGIPAVCELEGGNQ